VTKVIFDKRLHRMSRFFMRENLTGHRSASVAGQLERQLTAQGNPDIGGHLEHTSLYAGISQRHPSSKVLLPMGTTIHLIHGSMGHPSLHFQPAHNQFSRFCTADDS